VLETFVLRRNRFGLFGSQGLAGLPKGLTGGFPSKGKGRPAKKIPLWFLPKKLPFLGTRGNYLTLGKAYFGGPQGGTFGRGPGGPKKTALGKAEFPLRKAPQGPGPWGLPPGKAIWICHAEKIPGGEISSLRGALPLFLPVKHFFLGAFFGWAPARVYTRVFFLGPKRGPKRGGGEKAPKEIFFRRGWEKIWGGLLSPCLGQGIM